MATDLQPEQCGTPRNGPVILNKVRSFIGTWNNYTQEDWNTMEGYFKVHCTKFTMGKEVASTTGTPHIQFAGTFKNPRSFKNLKQTFPKCHWEQAKNPIATQNYCKKDNNFITEKTSNRDIKLQAFLEKRYLEVVWKPWQQQIITIANTAPHERHIHWFWEPTGNVGKSWTVEYLLWKKKCVLINGNRNDIFHCVKTWCDEHDDFPECILIDIPRTGTAHIQYGTMEKLKDRIFHSGKYEGGLVHMIPFHLLVFANVAPDTSTMSADRWQIVRIQDSTTEGSTQDKQIATSVANQTS